MTAEPDPSRESKQTSDAKAAAETIIEAERKGIDEPVELSWPDRLFRRGRGVLLGWLPRPSESQEAVAELVVAPDDEGMAGVAVGEEAVPILETGMEPGAAPESAPLSSDDVRMLIRQELGRAQGESRGALFPGRGEAKRWALPGNLDGVGPWIVLSGVLLVAALAILGIVLPRGASPQGDIYVELAALYQAVGKSDDSIQALDRAVELGVTDSTGWAKAGDVYRVSQEYGKAAIAYERAIATEANNADYHLGLARSYRALGRHQDAIEEYRRAIEWASADKDTMYVELGNSYAALGYYEQARAQYRMALQIDPEGPWAYYHTGESYRVQEQHASAIPYYREAIKLHPNPPWSFHVSLGRSYAGVGEYSEAVAEYARAQEAGPDRADPHFWSGEAYRSLGLYEEAVMAHEMAIELRPNVAAYYVGLAQDYLATDDCEEAVPLFSKALEFVPDNEVAMQGLAACQSE